LKGFDSLQLKVAQRFPTHAAEDRDLQEARDVSRKMAAAFTAMRESLGSP
jgi:hypothetical protein